MMIMIIMIMVMVMLVGLQAVYIHAYSDAFDILWYSNCHVYA